MPDAAGNFKGISTYGIRNRYLDELERRIAERQHQERERRRLLTMAMGRATYTPRADK